MVLDFLAVAGLPVMSNFLEKAKDIYLREPEKYEHWQAGYRLHK